MVRHMVKEKVFFRILFKSGDVYEGWSHSEQNIVEGELRKPSTVLLAKMLSGDYFINQNIAFCRSEVVYINVIKTETIARDPQAVS
jgi:hypothetical protein